MHYLTLACAALLLPLLLAGCAPEEEPRGVIPQGYEDAMDKVDNLEGKLQDAANSRMDTVAEGDQ